MKKFTAVVLTLIMIFSFAACSETQPKQPEQPVVINSLNDLFENGFRYSSFGFSRGKIKALYTSEDASSYYILSGTATDEMEKTFYELDAFSDSYEEDLQKLLESVGDLSIENADHMIPSQEELDKYVGKTLGDMAADGFSEWGSLFSDDTVIYTYSNGVYECDVTVDPETGSEDDPYPYVISEIRYVGISSDIINEPFDEEAMLARVKNENSVKAFYDNLFGAAMSSDLIKDDTFTINFTGYENGRDYCYDVVLGFDDAAKAKYEEVKALFDTDFDAYIYESKAFFSSLPVLEVREIAY